MLNLKLMPCEVLVNKLFEANPDELVAQKALTDGFKSWKLSTILAKSSHFEAN